MTDDDAAVPPRGLVAVGAAGLGLEAVVLLLAAPAVASLERGHVAPAGIAYLLAVAAALVVAASVLRRPGGRVVGSAVQVLAVVAGIVTWPMYVVGLLFAGLWVYWLRLWRESTSAHPVG